ncbi:UNVERIFIED_CONTAM: F-box protein: endocytic membrane traffic, recycling ReCYcling 1 [Siphonaria sp. JEL0065]|nr:F-box protein: endocytic membrane traffic, recycling ReCYcling 1 [Siphonaria sp. JEL0065]
MFSTAPKAKKTAVQPAPTLTTLPPDLVSRVFLFLPVSELARVAQVSRRVKILSYADDVYVPKLRALGVTLVDPLASTAALNDADPDADMERLAARLRQLPGAGNTVNVKYLETGSLFASTADPVDSATDTSEGKLSTPNAVVSSADDSINITVNTSTATTTTTSTTTTGVLSDKDQENTTSSDPGLALSPTKKISSALPQLKKSAIVIGAGGLKAAGKSPSALSIGANAAGKRSKSPSVSRATASTKPTTTKAGTYFPHLKGMRARDAFRAIYTELCPYYLDFRSHAKDSKIFRDHKDMIVVSQLLNRVSKFSRAKLILDTDDINFALETTIEWYESMLLGQFERAYDAKQISEMKRNATACHELNGGANCVQLFCAKNPIFFDHTFNPSLVASKLPSIASSTAEARGYALADDFAQFIDHTLVSCTTQATIVGQVFNSNMDAMTTFVSKVFEDSIAEYLIAVLTAARDGEGVAIYLHTLATSVHSCDQFLGFISTADAKVNVRTELIRDAMRRIFAKDWDGYVTVEMDYLGKRIENELKKWNNRARTNAGSPNQPAAYLTDAEKAMAHKREVMSTFKKVLFAPVALGKSVGNALMGNKSKGQTESLLGNDSGNLDSSIASTSASSGLNTKDTVTYHLDDGSLGSLVSLELCLNLMHMSKESLGRMLVITNALENSQLKANAGKVFVRLLQAIGEGHMNPAFSSAISRLERSTPVDNWSEKAVNIDSLQFFELVHIADLVHQMLDVYFTEDVRPWIDENDFLSDVMIEKKSFDRSSDDNVAHGMDKAIQVLVNQVDHILDTTQLPTDYNPSNENNVYDFKPTKACLDVIACLNAHTRLLNGVTNKDTLEVFFGEVGVRLFNVITKNLKKQQVSQSGALQLICDMNKYYEWSTTLRVASVPRLFLVLKELGSLYMADGGDELRNLVHDSERYQGALRPEEIYELLASRTDYKKIQKYVEAKECIVM